MLNLQVPTLINLKIKKMKLKKLKTVEVLNSKKIALIKGGTNIIQESRDFDCKSHDSNRLDAPDESNLQK